MKDIKIDHHLIGPKHPPFIIAELSGNHNQSLEKAMHILEAAALANVHAIKLQTYTPDTITLKSDREEFQITNKSSLWAGRSLYDLYQEAHLPWEWHKPLFEKAKNLGITIFSTPFDETAVDFLEELDVPCYKIGSNEIVDIPLLRKAAKTQKPILISTGASTLLEIEEAVNAVREEGNQQIILLKCTAAYPANPLDANLRTLPHLAETFGAVVGLSDHSIGIGVGVASVVLGASVIEKHFTISRADGGVDSAFSMEPGEMAALVVESHRAWESLGKVQYELMPSEIVAHEHRPSLYFVEDIAEGEILQPHHVRSVRPAKGLPPKEIDLILGLPLLCSVKANTPVSWKAFKHEN